MSTTTLHGKQLRAATVGRNKVDAAFEAQIALLESNVQTIFNTMSTDTERLAAIDAVTTAWQSADGNLQTMITNMVNATKTGAGLNSDGSFTLPEGQNYMTGAVSLKQALGLLDAALKVEEAARVSADTSLQANINALVAAGGATAQQNLDAEIAARTAADTALQTQITNETTARTNADTNLQTQIDNEVTARNELNTTLSTALAAEATARTTALSTEAATRAAADTALQNSLDAESLARATADAAQIAAINDEVTARTLAMTAEQTARAAADTAMDGRVQVLEGQVSTNLNYSKFINRETPVGDVDGTNALFVLAYTPYAGSEMVFLNGQLQEPGAGNDYTITDKDVTFAVAPDVGDRVKVTYFR